MKFFQKLGKSLMLPVSALPICGLLMGLGYYLCPSAMQGGEIEGFAAGSVFVLKKEKNEKYEIGSSEEEKEKLEEAVLVLKEKLKSRQDKDNQDLIEAELMILQDDGFIPYAQNLIEKENITAPNALKEAEKSLCEKLEASGSDYIKERCTDVKGMAKAILDYLMGNTIIYPKHPFILASEDLSPADISMIEPDLILGILTETGSPTSHVSIMAGNMDIPYLYGVSDIFEKITSGDFVILDAEKSVITINPSQEIKNNAIKQQEQIIERKKTYESETNIPDTKTRIYANIGGINELDALKKSGAEGIGLVRSEFLFLGRKEAPSEDEQFETYKHIAEAMPGKEVVIRTLDIGSDKQAEWFTMSKEPNPALGMRGLRVSLADTELFRIQLKALFRAAVYGNLKIMVPMITACWEIDSVLEEIKLSAKELENRKVSFKIPPLGVMIETPAAVMIASELASKVSFFSIGTNDLTQYTLAIDREAKNLDRYYDPLHEAVFKMIELTVKAAHSHNIPVTVCGELGSNPDAIEKLIEIGVDELSVSAQKVMKVRKTAAEAEEKHSVMKSSKVTGIKAPCDGELIPMEEIPDQAFSSGMMGECIGIIPENGTIYAPIDGVVSTIAKNKHAISFKNNSSEILVHVGIDTVKLNGEGFTLKVKPGDRVVQGQPVMEADIEKIKEKRFDPMVIVVLTMCQ